MLNRREPMKEITAYLSDDGLIYQIQDDARRADINYAKRALLKSIQIDLDLPDNASIDSEALRLATVLDTGKASLSTISPAIIKPEDVTP
jgi:hypothetical protein